jgi:NTE family protein
MGENALVLGGGGHTGIAWELGMLAGLAEHGVNLAGADVIVGTSAGSIVGADLRSGQSLTTLYEAQLAPPEGEIAARMSAGTLLGYAWAMLSTRDPVRARQKVGRLALAARTEPEAERRKIIEGRLPGFDRPAADLRITAVDAQTGELAVFDAASGVSLVDAVGASCAVPGVWPPVTIGSRRYIDGGMRSPANADLAAGYLRVAVIAPLTRGFGHITRVARQVAGLTRSGAVVTVIEPDAASLKAIGRNILDPVRRRPGPGSPRRGRPLIPRRWSGRPAERPGQGRPGHPGPRGQSKPGPAGGRARLAAGFWRSGLNGVVQQRLSAARVAQLGQ